jgi:hypothetical protein
MPWKLSVGIDGLMRMRVVVVAGTCRQRSIGEV